jgi:nucleotidyltransferase/DNA polymerase involved in DNA repair
MHDARMRFTSVGAAATSPTGNASSTPDTRIRVVAPGEAAAFLAPLSVDRLPVSDEMRRRLRWLGLKTAGELAALPRATLAAQFGPEGATAWDLARGEGGGVLVPRRHAPPVSAGIDFDQPVTETPAILAAARHLLNRLLRRPECAGRSLRGVELKAFLSNGHRWQRLVTFREPVADQGRVVRIIGDRIEGVVFPAAVESLELQLHDLCAETGIQSSLFSARARELQGLDDALEHLHARYGRPLVMKIVGVEPWSRIPERQYALIAYEPSTAPSR